MSRTNFFARWRYYFVLLILIIGLIGVVARLLYLNIIDRNFLLKQSEARVMRIVDIPAYRGMITDRFGQPLAVSTPVDSVWANPQIFQANDEKLKQLAQLLGIKLKDIRAVIAKSKREHREFVYLARELPPPVTDNIKALAIEGIFFEREYRRYYPQGEVIAQVIGFTNIY